jgi:hypothetical protein
MARYFVCVTYDASVTIEVEADSEEEARDKALEEAPHVSLCHQCAGKIEVNGDPMDIAGDPWKASEGE